MIKEGIEKEGVSRTFLHIRQLLLLQGCCLEGLVQVLAWIPVERNSIASDRLVIPF